MQGSICLLKSAYSLFPLSVRSGFDEAQAIMQILLLKLEWKIATEEGLNGRKVKDRTLSL